MSIFCFDSQY